MGRIRLELCMISARGLRRSTLLKPHWFAVGWIDSESKFCTKIDTSGSSTPTWKTKFSYIIDEAELNVQEMSVTVEVHSRDPVFLKEKLQGTAVVKLKEFFAKFQQDRDASGTGIEETGSFQLRKHNSGKPQGFIDLSINVYEDSYSEIHGADNGNGINLAIGDGPVLTFPKRRDQPATSQLQSGHPYSQLPTPQQRNFPDLTLSGPKYKRRPTPPPPLPPSNTGFLPALFPGPSQPWENYGNIQQTGFSDRGAGAGFGLGVGTGALAAGAMLFGDDFMSDSTFMSS